MRGDRNLIIAVAGRRGSEMIGMYHDGYSKARENLQQMTTEQLLVWIDDMWGGGREKIQTESDHDEVLAEALRQCGMDFRNNEHDGWMQVEFWGKIHAAGGLR